MKKRAVQLGMVLAVILCVSSYAASHCEVPCGIYDDNLRFKMIAEDIDTIEKAMKQIQQLAKEKPINYNQLVRWINTKEDHANRIQHTVSQYFMTQKVKLGSEHYTEKLSILHHMLVYAMKCKQTTDLKNAEILRDLLHKYSHGDFDYTHKKDAK
ncbi:MAG: superoxide dismutase [Ni] [Deltaproteobacteria bacterium]|nr:superoxide dismutase [Ni] [Deltaproteobacteria bacterium]